ncbi:hypothetical protein SUGI_1018660 [Cryptomeria japonica]|nr:hypothetical protein SUGI_1018660 [Cryptomeria japonica]
MEEGSCVATLAERELARRSHILSRLIERNRALARRDLERKAEKLAVSSPSRVEPPTPPLFYRSSPRPVPVREYEEDLKHLQSLRAEVEHLGKTQEPPTTPKIKCEKRNPCVGQNRRSDAKGVMVLVKSSEGARRREMSGAAAPACKLLHSPPVSEVNLAAVAAAMKVRVKAADMPPILQERAFRCARQCLDSMDKLNSKRVALILKKEFDTSYGHAWHCIVGTSFGSFVTHSLGGFLYFSVDKVSILLFKTTVEPLDQ